MLALRVQVPLACWRKGHAREFLESEIIPPPSTCYGMLLSLVGETERERHLGVRVTAGLFNAPATAVVLRTLWRIKDRKTAQGNGENAKPDFQQLIVEADLVMLCDSTDEHTPGPTLEHRVRSALDDPDSVERFGGLSLGESTHLVNEVDRIDTFPRVARVFTLAARGSLTLPVWVDHVGSAGTKYAVGDLVQLSGPPKSEDIPTIAR
jgi:CRISPR-associated protein Cas5t